MNPHFIGKGSIRVATIAWVHRDGDAPLDGALQGWAAPENDDPDSGVYPVVSVVGGVLSGTFWLSGRLTS
jgi:hypothetical protein